VLNALGLDFATFGNHEFDLPKDQFRARLRESAFTWFSSNVTDGLGNPYPGVPRHLGDFSTIVRDYRSLARWSVFNVPARDGPWISRNMSRAIRPWMVA